MIEDLEIALDKSCQFICENFSEFLLCHAENQNGRMALMKPLGELVLVMTLLKKWSFESKLPSYFTETAWNELHDGETILKILLARFDLPVVSGLYANFEELGYKNEKIKKTIEYLSCSKSSNSIELPEWRRLDVMHAYASLGIKEFQSPPYDRIWLHGLPEPWTITEDIAYALTHEVFYITDFGFQPERMPSHINGYLKLWLPAWFKIYREIPHWDLFGELLMVCSCIGLRSDEWRKFGMYFISAQNGDGTFPTPESAAKNLLFGVERESRRYFLKNYHTVLVGIMAMVMMLRDFQNPRQCI